jgi:hypothetical protein
MANGDGTKSSPEVLARLRALPSNHPTRVKARARTRAWIKENPTQVAKHRQKRRRRERAWAKANPEAARHRARTRQLKKYGLTPEQWDALFASQGGACAICETKNSFGRWHTDHDDTLGPEAVRGILCVRCNIGIGQLQHDPVLLMKAADYVRCAKEQFA